MDNAEIVSAIDEEIARLERAKVLLAGCAAVSPKRGRGRPPKSVASSPAPKKRKMSAAARAKIAAAQRARWAKAKRTV